MADKAVVNASPIIYLGRAGRLDLLRHIADQILVPEPVAREVARRGANDPAAKALSSASSWVIAAPAIPVPDAVLEWNLGPGESAVISTALAHSGMEAIIDDLAGRKCAAGVGVPVRGTLGIVLVLKKRGIVPKARPLMEELISAGMFLSRSVLDEALRRVGE